MALSRGVRVQTAGPSGSLWAAVVAVRVGGLLLCMGHGGTSGRDRVRADTVQRGTQDGEQARGRGGARGAGGRLRFFLDERGRRVPLKAAGFFDVERRGGLSDLYPYILLRL